jgi:nucleoside-diphosphate-sugar epimerase
MGELKTGAPEASVRAVLVSGADSQIGRFLLPRLAEAGYRVFALSRRPHSSDSPRWTWLQADLTQADAVSSLPEADCLIHLAPLVLLPEFLERLAPLELRRVIAFSSASRLSKADSPIPKERVFAENLARAEQAVAAIGARFDIAWTLFRPTLIYGAGMDRNVSFIRRCARFGFFPLLGKASGLRQPVHADDLAAACVKVLDLPAAFGRIYALAGREILPYRDLVSRVFEACGRKPRFLHVPLAFFRSAMALVSLFPRYRDFNAAMAERMNRDLLADNDPAIADFGYSPRNFEP